MNKAIMYDIQYGNYIADLSMYKSLLNKSMPIIEFGSGTGRISSYLLKNGYRVFGIEKDSSYRKHFTQKTQNQTQSYNFEYIDNPSELNFPFNIIFPFNVLFYLTESELQEEIKKLSNLPFNVAIFETDNIHQISKENLSPKIHSFNNYIFSEKPILIDNRILIKNEIFKDQKKISTFIFPLFLHKAKHLIETYNNNFGKIEFYGDFDKSKYTYDSPKLICIANI